MKIIITGASGFVGSALVNHLLAGGHRVVTFSRNAPSNIPTAVRWDGVHPGNWKEHVNSAEAIINLAGENISGGRWSESQKSRILNSRLASIRALAAGIEQAQVKPKIFIQASAIGYYGSVPEGDVTEARSHGNDFLAKVCVSLESEAQKISGMGLRTVLLRTGVVLEKDGGALLKMAAPFRFFLGGHLGNGRQWFSWIHRADLLSIFSFILETPSLSGAVNATAPEPVRQKEFCRIMGSVLHRPSWAHVPGFMLKILAGELSDMLLTGQRVIPQKLQAAGFRFDFPTCESALADIFN